MTVREPYDLNIFYLLQAEGEHFITLGALAFLSDCRDGGAIFLNRRIELPKRLMKFCAIFAVVYIVC